MALYYNGIMVSGINFTPRLTLAEYNALEVKPDYWIRTDVSSSDIDKIPASEISVDLGSGNYSNVQTELNKINDSINLNGAKNYIPYPFISISNDRFTINSDGSISVTSGTVSTRTILHITHHETYWTLPVGKYILSKGMETPSTGSSMAIVVDGCNSDGWIKNLAKSTNPDEVEFEVDYDGYDRIEIYAVADSGYTVPENAVFYPMIRLASNNDSTFEPFAMTNRAITNELNTNRLKRFRASGSRYTDSINIRLDADKVNDSDFIVFQAFIVGSNTAGPVHITLNKDSVSRAKAILTYVDNNSNTLQTVLKTATWDSNYTFTISFSSSEQINCMNWCVLDLYAINNIIDNFWIESHL